MHDIANPQVVATIENDWSEDDRRTYERYVVDFYLRVTDDQEHTSLGEVVDISLGGMKLIADHQVALGGIADYRIDLAMENGFRSNIAFQASIDWVRRAEDRQHFYLGLEFVSPTQELLDVIQRIIAELGG